MALITLTSDFGLSDYYVASVKGAIYNELPVVTLVDLSHNIPRDDIAHAAFTVKQASESFPTGSIHLVSIKPEYDEDSPYVLTRYKGSYFIATDNGFFSLLFHEPPDLIIELRINDEHDYSFPMKHVFAKAACHIARGGAPELLGQAKPSLRQMMSFEPIVNQANIKGVIKHIDGYGNLITNISNSLYTQIAQRREAVVSLRSAQHSIKNVSSPAKQIAEGDLACRYGGSGYLEIFIKSGNAAQLLGQHLNDSVFIQFY